MRIPSQQRKRLRRLILALERWGAACEQGHSSQQARRAAARALPMCASLLPIIVKVVKPADREPVQAFRRMERLASFHSHGKDLSGYWTAYQDLLWPSIGYERTLIDTLKEALE